jgi:transposase
MGQTFRTCALDQPFLFSPSLDDWLPQNHLARFIADVVHELDLSAITQAYGRKDNRGPLAYHPEMMTRLLLYAYCVNQPSSRKIEEATVINLAFRYLAANQQPDHKPFCPALDGTRERARRTRKRGQRPPSRTAQATPKLATPTHLTRPAPHPPGHDYESQKQP